MQEEVARLKARMPEGAFKAEATAVSKIRDGRGGPWVAAIRDIRVDASIIL